MKVDLPNNHADNPPRLTTPNASQATGSSDPIPNMPQSI